MTTICVDVMGSDRDPEVMLEGIASALADDPDLCVLVAGSASVVEPFCAAHERAEALSCEEIITMDEHPVTAVRHKKDASVVRAAAAVRAGKADGMFSAGSTGAVLAAATFGVGRLPGVKRPPLAAVLPGSSGHETVVLDLGANADVRPESLVQFAHMGRAYAQAVCGIAEPRVALLSNGTEKTKGSEAALAAHKALSAADCGFVGNAEGTDVLAGTFDVIVADGFTGNIALKSMEGTAKFVAARLKQAMKTSLVVKIGLVLIAKVLRAVTGELSGDEHGGAILLGLKAPVVKGHGATSPRAVYRGIQVAVAAVRGQLCERIASACAPHEVLDSDAS